MKAVMLGAALTAGCGLFGGAKAKSFQLTAAAELPAAAGTVQLSKGENGNTGFSVQVKHLARPTRVTPGAVTYVVWVQPRASALAMAPMAPTPNVGTAQPTAQTNNGQPGQPGTADAAAPAPGAAPAPAPAATQASSGQPPPQNVGGLVVDKELTGRLNGQTAYREFDIFVTAEAEASVTQPSGMRLLWAQVRP